MEPLADVVQTHGAVATVVKSRAVVANFHDQRVTRNARSQSHGPTVNTSRNAVLHRVLDQRLDRQHRDQDRLGRRVDLDSRAQAFAQTKFFDFEIRSHDLHFLGERDEAAIGLQEVAENVGEIECHAARVRGFAGNRPVEGVQGVEQEMWIDLRLQRAQLRLRNQALQFGMAQALHFLYDHRAQFGEFLQVFAQVQAAALAAPQQQTRFVALRKSQRHGSFDPRGVLALTADREFVGAKESTDQSRGVLHQILFAGRANTGIADRRDDRLARRPPEDFARQQQLHASAECRQHDQQETSAGDQQSLEEGIARRVLQQMKTQVEEDSQRDRPAGQRAVYNKAQKSIEEEKSVILQQHVKGERNARVVKDQFARPRARRMCRAEMQKRNRKEKQTHAGERRR